MFYRENTNKNKLLNVSGEQLTGCSLYRLQLLTDGMDLTSLNYVVLFFPWEWIFPEVLLFFSLSTEFQFLGGMSNTMKTGVIASLLGILCSILESRKSDSSVDSLLKAM